MGVIRNLILKSFDIEKPVYFADIVWDELLKATKKVKVSYTDLPKFPAVRRDLALLVDKNVTFAQIEEVAYASEKRLLKEVTLFDVYEGKNLEEGKKSYAVAFMLQDETQTLNDKQIEKVMNSVIHNLETKLEAKLR